MRRINSVRNAADPAGYGEIEFVTDTRKPPITLTIGVSYWGEDCPCDIVLHRNGKVLKHPYGGTGRASTEEERAAVGWTW